MAVSAEQRARGLHVLAHLGKRRVHDDAGKLNSTPDALRIFKKAFLKYGNTQAANSAGKFMVALHCADLIWTMAAGQQRGYERARACARLKHVEVARSAEIVDHAGRDICGRHVAFAGPINHKRFLDFPDFWNCPTVATLDGNKHGFVGAAID